MAECTDETVANVPRRTQRFQRNAIVIPCRGSCPHEPHLTCMEKAGNWKIEVGSLQLSTRGDCHNFPQKENFAMNAVIGKACNLRLVSFLNLHSFSEVNMQWRISGVSGNNDVQLDGAVP